MYNPRLYFKASYSVDLYENNCVDCRSIFFAQKIPKFSDAMTSSACTFMRVNGGGLKSVSDQLIQNVGSFDECEQMCVIRSRISDVCRFVEGLNYYL